jgi:putative DNA primase/helicase
VRVFEIPTPDAGAFVELHGERDGATCADGLRAAAIEHYGVAGDAWLQWLTAHREDARTFLLELVRTLCDAWILHATDAGQTKRVAARFALVAAAGELATRAGITGWTNGEASRAAKRLLDDWLAARGTRGDAEELAAIRQVAGILQQHAESYFPYWHRAVDDHRPNAPKRWGLRKLSDWNGTALDDQAKHDLTMQDGRGDETAATFYVTSTAFREDVCRGLDARYAARVLQRRGYLIPENDRRLDRNERLPGIGKVRCYVIRPELFSDDSLA